MVLINELIGNFGKYHWFLCIIIFANKVGVAFHQMAIIFLAPPAEYHCPDRNETCCDNPIYDKSKYSRTIVMEWNLICERVWLKDLTQTFFQFGVLSGSLVFGMASDKYGRRPSLLASVIMSVFFGIMCSFLPDFWSFTIVRTALGFAVGGVMVIGFVILMEYVGSAKRDLVSALYHVPFTLGYIVLAVFGYFIRDYMYFLLVISLTNVILLVYICILPESPRWLLAANKTFKAITLMERVAKINKLPTDEIQHKIEFYQLEHRSKNQRKGSLIDLFRTPNMRKNILVMSFTWLVCSYCFYGMAYYISHLTGDVYVNVMASGIVCLPFGKWCAPVAFGIFPLIAALLCLLLPETKDCELMMTLEEGEALGKKLTREQEAGVDIAEDVT
ncbi:organic cation transporter-like protein isoform X2 [Ostrinia nubilalis]|uniref:organic cation transporter-like protein isoform X2 n=1 Tax=Ostrinia nubilalis TaxID=29057 RepID=UPI00308264CC